MTVKAQYNPSTGLMSYNPDTGLVQVAEFLSCIDCDNPDEIKVTISGVTACCYEVIPENGLRFKITQAMMNLINSEHTLTNDNPCNYSVAYTVDEPDWIGFWVTPPDDCALPADTGFPVYQVIVRVRIPDIPPPAAGEILVRISWRFSSTQFGSQIIQEWQEPLTLPCYDQTLTDASKTDCSDVSIDSASFTTEVIGGTAVIEAVP